jgi:predicted SAM-dependent methyltransferase/tetratricopeptide (TPR) repeat protein
MGVRLHLGCGLIHRAGWINLDHYAAEAADLLADAVLLPFVDGCAEAIEALQLVEHLGYVGALYGLHEWARVLSPGSTLLIETPDRPATLRAALDRETGDEARPWLFGTEQRGQSHRYLFAADELARMATRAGFEKVAVERAARPAAHPILRLTARRAADTLAIRFAVRFHRALVSFGVVDPSDAPQYLAALETVCERGCKLVSFPGAEALIQLASLAARYGPRVAACALDALPDPPAWPEDELARVRDLIAELEVERFPARLACRWRELPKQPGVADDAWALLEREISLYLTARLYPGEGLDELREAFDAATIELAPSDLDVDLFCREALTDAARHLTARGARAFARGELERAAQAFEAAVGYDPDLAWPRWNLARLYLKRGRRLDALAQYEALQAGLPDGLRPAFEREMDAVTGRHGRAEGFTVPLADLGDLLEAAG